MKRRVFLGAAALGGAALAAPAVAQGGVALTLSSAWAPGDRRHDAAAADLINWIGVTSGGRIQVARADGVSGVAAYRAAADGSVSMCLGAEELWREIHPAYALFTATPGGMTSDELEAWLLWGGGGALWRGLAEKQGLVPFLAGDFGISAVWARAALEEGADLSGLSIASSGLGAEVWRALGAEAVDLASAPAAAAPGGVALLEGPSAADFAETKLERSLPVLMQPSFNRPTDALSLNVNAGALAALSEADRAILRTAAARAHAGHRAKSRVENMSAMALMRELGAITPARIPDDALTAMAGAARGVIDAIAAHDFDAEDIIFSYRKALTELRGWSELSERAYTDARREALKA